MREILLIQMSGRDRPGLLAAFMRILARSRVNVLDIGQAVIHDDLSLGLLVEMPANLDSSTVLKDVLFQAHEMAVTVRFRPVAGDAYEDWVAAEGHARYIVTLLARHVTAEQLADVSATIAGHGLTIENIARLSGRQSVAAEVSRESATACIELTVRGEPGHSAEMRKQFLDIANRLSIDIAFQRDNAWRRNRRLVAFDMDSTLIDGEVIDELARLAGVGEQVVQITEAAMRGELDFQESFRRRVALLKGLDESAMRQVIATIPLTEGAENLVSTLKTLGYKTAILSGGFTFMGQYLQQRLGIAFRAKPLVRETARQAISTLGLDGILYLLGVRDRDRTELMR